MIELKDVKAAYLQDIAVKPYFLRDTESPNNHFLFTIGYEALYEISRLFTKKVFTPKQIKLVYESIWNRLDTLLEVKTQYFQLYFDYTIEIIEFYKELLEQAEEFEACENLKRLQNEFDKKK